MEKRALFIIDGRAYWPRRSLSFASRTVDGPTVRDAHGREWRTRFYTGEAAVLIDDRAFLYRDTTMRQEERHGRKIVYLTAGDLSEEAYAEIDAAVADMKKGAPGGANGLSTTPQRSAVDSALGPCSNGPVVEAPIE